MLDYGSKDTRCPNCGGRSYDASGGDDSYHVCQLCERPSLKFHTYYQEHHPDVYAWFISARSDLDLLRQGRSYGPQVNLLPDGDEQVVAFE